MMVLLDTHTPIPSRWASDRLNDDDDCDNCPPLHRCLVGSWDFELHHRIVHETASNKAGLGLYGTKRSNTKRNVARKQIIKKKKGGLRPETTFFFFFFSPFSAPAGLITEGVGWILNRSRFGQVLLKLLDPITLPSTDDSGRHSTV